MIYTYGFVEPTLYLFPSTYNDSVYGINKKLILLEGATITVDAKKKQFKVDESNKYGITFKLWHSVWVVINEFRIFHLEKLDVWII